MSFVRVADDGARVAFQTPSLTTEGELYQMHLNRRSGELCCDCPNAVYRDNNGHVNRPGEGCKHIRLFHTFLPSAPLGSEDV